LNEDPAEPLYAKWEAQQQHSLKNPPPRIKPQRPLRDYGSLEARHKQNLGLDLDIGSLSLDTRLQLQAEGAELEPDEDYGFMYEEAMNDDLEG
jgi:hypothetical protein